MKRLILCLVAIALLASTLLLPTSAAGEFYAKRAVRISPTEILVEFSAPLTNDALKSPFIALRRMVMQKGQPKSLAWDGKDPLQAPMTSYRFWSKEDTSRVIFAFDETMINEYLDTENKYYQRGYRSFFGIEEKNPGSGHSHKTLQGVKAKDGSELASTLPGSGNEWDGVYLTIETDYSYGLGELPDDPTVTLPADTGSETDSADDGKDAGCSASMPAPMLLLPIAALALGSKKRR